jgi:hypothetical protein
VTGVAAATTATVSGQQFKARPMPDFKALHGKPAILPRTVHTPTAIPTIATASTANVTATVNSNTNTRRIATSTSTSSLSSKYNNQVRTATKDANKENAKKSPTSTSSANACVKPTRPLTIKKGI